MLKTLGFLAVISVVALAPVAAAQGQNAAFQKVADDYMAAFNKGDAKGVTDLYTNDALRVSPDGRLLDGKAAIEKSYVEAFAGPFKGATLKVTITKSRTLGADTALIAGTWEVSGATAPSTRGQFVNSLKREGGSWKLSSVATIPDQPAR